MKSLDQITQLVGTKSLKNLNYELQNADYEGCTFQIGETMFRSRLAKLTPKKKGYFVAFWEKDANNQNIAFQFNNSPDKLIIVIDDDQQKGQFIIPKDELRKRHVLTDTNKVGKMAMRVYPSWIKDLNSSAQKTQAWQCQYFVDAKDDDLTEKINVLYSLK